MLAQPVSSRTALILVIDPEPANQRAMRDCLIRIGFTTRLADDFEAAVSIVEATPPDVVLLPTNAGGSEGWGKLEALLNNWGIPVLRLAGSVEPGAAASPISQISDTNLKLRVDASLRTRNMYKALVIENTRLAAERLHDALTGLYNRRYIMVRIEEEIKRSSRHSYPLSCLLLDIDNFKAVNESWGHMVGDGVLRDAAHVITRTMRSTDVVARYRGDQFISLLTDTDPTGAQIAANRLRDAISDFNFFNRTGHEAIKLSASVGIAYWQPSSRPGEGTWEPQLIALAERALRAAQLSGPNRLVMLQAA